MNDILKAYLQLDAEHLITNAEKAARVLGIYSVVTSNSTDALWAIVNGGEAGSAIVGSEPVLEIATEGPTPKPGVRPKVAGTRAAGR